MKRETRHFTVEVRRGGKKQPATILPSSSSVSALPSTPPSEKTAMQRAEEILFARDPAAGAKEGSAKEAAPQSRRILEPVQEPLFQEPPRQEAESPVRRRGRPLGSKNRSLGTKSSPKAPRGRPRLAPEVRQLTLTPELVSAAIESMTKLEPDHTLPVHSEIRSFVQRNGFDESGAASVKRPKGRPRKSSVASSNEEAGELDPAGVNDGASRRETSQPSAPRRALQTDGGGGDHGDVFRNRFTRSDLSRLFKPGERWKARMRLRAIARRRRA